jgi:hypothetical protein
MCKEGVQFMKITYQVYSNCLKGNQYCRAQNYRSKERAMEDGRRLMKVFGNAYLITFNKHDYGYELISEEEIKKG